MASVPASPPSSPPSGTGLPLLLELVAVVLLLELLALLVLLLALELLAWLVLELLDALEPCAPVELDEVVLVVEAPPVAPVSVDRPPVPSSG
jgi:hypothetical protein